MGKKIKIKNNEEALLLHLTISIVSTVCVAYINANKQIVTKKFIKNSITISIVRINYDTAVHEKFSKNQHCAK